MELITEETGFEFECFEENSLHQTDKKEFLEVLTEVPDDQLLEFLNGVGAPNA